MGSVYPNAMAFIDSPAQLLSEQLSMVGPESYVMYLMAYFCLLLLTSLSAMADISSLTTVLLLIFLLGLPPMPTFFMKMSLLLVLASSNSYLLALFLLLGYFTSWYLLFTYMKLLLSVKTKDITTNSAIEIVAMACLMGLMVTFISLLMYPIDIFFLVT